MRSARCEASDICGGAYAAARRLMTRSLRNNPLDPKVWVDLARVLAMEIVDGTSRR